MLVGQMMIYCGIGLIAVGLIALIVTNVIFAKQRNKLIDKIYGKLD